jgi:hypothetical protein
VQRNCTGDQFRYIRHLRYEPLNQSASAGCGHWTSAYWAYQFAAQALGKPFTVGRGRLCTPVESAYRK